MYLAINYSTPASELIASMQIEVDYLKTPNWDWMVEAARKLRPVAIHYDLEAGNGRLDGVDWDQIKRLSDESGTPYINIHIDPKQKHHPGVSIDSNKKSDRDKVYNIILSDVMTLVSRFGSDRVIMENSPYRGEPGKTLRLSVEPDLISRLVNSTGCGFLLDISHAVISSHYIGMDPFEYFKQLPTHAVRELHFAGIHKVNGFWVDHLSIMKKDWHWLEWVFEHFLSGEWSIPWLLSFEYGGVGPEFEWRTKPEVISKQVPLLYKRVTQLNNYLKPLRST